MKNPEDTTLYQPSSVAGTLGVSTAMLRRYAQAYERVFGELPRDRREGRLYSQEAIDRLGLSRELVQQRKVASIELALRHLSEGGESPSLASPPTKKGDSGSYELLFEELKRLRLMVEEQNRRFAIVQPKTEAMSAPEATKSTIRDTHDPTAVSDTSEVKSAEEEDAQIQANQLGSEEFTTTKARGVKVGLAVVLAGGVPVSAANLVLVVAYSQVGYEINQPPLLTAFLVFYLLVHLLPLPLGVWAGLVWPGRRLRSYALLSASAGAVEAICDWLVIKISSGLIVLTIEDYLAIFSTFTLFLSGQLYGGLIEKQRRRVALEPSRGVTKEASSTTPLSLMQVFAPALIGLLGTIITALATVIVGLR